MTASRYRSRPPPTRPAGAPPPPGCGGGARRPSELARRGLVAGEQHRDQLVAQLDVAQRAALLVAGTKQEREHVVASVVVPRRQLLAPECDLLVEQLVDPRAQADVAPPRAPGPQVLAQSRTHERRRLREGHVEQAGQQAAQLVGALGLPDAEHDLHDHLERDRLRDRPQRERLPDGPGAHLPLGDLLDHLRPALEAVAVEGFRSSLRIRRCSSSSSRKSECLPPVCSISV